MSRKIGSGYGLEGPGISPGEGNSLISSARSPLRGSMPARLRMTFSPIPLALGKRELAAIEGLPELDPRLGLSWWVRQPARSSSEGTRFASSFALLSFGEKPCPLSRRLTSSPIPLALPTEGLSAHSSYGFLMPLPLTLPTDGLPTRLRPFPETPALLRLF
jgi:hypothetical protein